MFDRKYNIKECTAEKMDWDSYVNYLQKKYKKMLNDNNLEEKISEVF